MTTIVRVLASNWCARLMSVTLLTLCVTAQAHADEEKSIRARASGQLIYQEPCEGPSPSAPRICQAAIITGQVTHIGRISGMLTEIVDPVTGRYTGTGEFTTPSGDTFTTTYDGQIVRQDAGYVEFVEWHELARGDGTGRFADATGALVLSGSATAQGRIEVDGTGTLIR